VGPIEAGLYVRTPHGVATRLHPHRIDWTTLTRHTSPAEPIVLGDRLAIGTHGGSEHEGHLLEPIDDRVVLTTNTTDTPFSAHLTRTRAGEFKLLFRTDNLYPGEEFRLRSFSGHSYRGYAIRVDPERIRILVSESGERMVLSRRRVDFATLEVFVRVAVSLLGSPPDMGQQAESA
jgi:hypothetical protein